MRIPHQRLFSNLSFAALAIFFPPMCAAQTGPPPPLNEFRVISVGSDGAGLAVAPCIQIGRRNDCASAVVTFHAGDKGEQAIVKSLNAGDHVAIFYDGSELKSLHVLRKSLSPRDEPTAFWRKFWTFAGWAAVLWLIAVALTRGHVAMLVVGMDNRYSNSKFQLALWFWVLIGSYLTVLSLRVSACGWDFLGGVDIPQNLLLLSGLSALSYGGAKAITTGKSNAVVDDLEAKAAAAGAVMAGAVVEAANPAPGAQVNVAVGVQAARVDASTVPVTPKMMPKGSERFWRDLVQNDFGQFDFGDFQMLIVTLLAVGTYIVFLFHYLDYFAVSAQVYLPDVDTTVLAAFGVGQGAYLTKKAAGNLGSS